MHKPSTTIKTACAALAALSTASTINATPITDFTSVTVDLNVSDVTTGGQGFFVNLASPASTTIGAGAEFTLNIGASGFTTKQVLLDFDASGQVSAVALSQFAIGNTSFSSFSFDLNFSFPDALITDATVSGDLVRGDTSVAGLDPAVWTFENEQDNSFGNVMTFGSEPNVPRLDFDADIPEPSTLSLLALSGVLVVRRRRSRA